MNTFCKTALQQTLFYSFSLLAQHLFQGFPRSSFTPVKGNIPWNSSCCLWIAGKPDRINVRNMKHTTDKTEDKKNNRYWRDTNCCRDNAARVHILYTVLSARVSDLHL